MPFEIRIFSLVMLLAGLFIGCDHQNQQEPVSDTDDLQAAEILDFVLEQYAEATSYQDQAVLYLAYRLNGRAIQEPHPWSLAWNKSNQLSADWFNARIRCDGQSLSCYVFDIESGNIDNQQIVIPIDGRVPVQTLIDDKIARHFIFGTSELPLDESEAEKINPLVHPILGFLDRKLERDWLVSPQSTAREPDSILNELACYVLKISKSDKDYRIWVGQKSGQIEQIEFPLQYLHSDVLASSEISDLKFFVRFHRAELSKDIPASRFELKEKLAAKPVRNFITLPQPMASELIGEAAPEFSLFSQEGKKVAFDSLDGKAIVFLWLGASEFEKHIDALNQFSKDFDTDSVKFIAVYSDEHLELPGSKSIEPVQPLRQLDLGAVRLLYDQQLDASVALKLKAVPSILVLDKDHLLQYAKAIDSDEWREHTKAAVQRIFKGDQVAKEMKLEYQKFLDDYHRQLVAANPSPVANGSESFQPPNKIEETARLEWESSTLRDPGNIHLPEDSKSLLVIDGWQTVIQFDRSNGQLLGKHLLNLPDDAAVNRIRSFKSGSGELTFVAFSLLGKHAFVFDENWKLRIQYPESGKATDHAGITECQLGDFNGDGEPELLCSFLSNNGIRSVNIDTGLETQLLKNSTKSFLRTEENLLHLFGDQLAIDGTLDAIFGDSRSVSRIIVGPIPKHCLAIGVDVAGKWEMSQLTDSGSTIWSTAIGPQFLESEIEPICVSKGGRDQNRFIAVVSSDGKLSNYSLDGKLITSYKLAVQPAGVAAWETSHGKYLALSSDKRLRIWNLQEFVSGMRHGAPDSRRR